MYKVSERQVAEFLATQIKTNVLYEHDRRILSTHTYTVGHKKRATFIFMISLANVDRFQ